MNGLIESMNMWGDRFLFFALPMLAQSTLLIVLLFLIDLVIRKYVRAVLLHALWLLLLLKLVLPPSLALPTGPGYWIRANHPMPVPENRLVVANVRIGDAAAGLPPTPVALRSPATPSLHLSAVLGILWLAGGVGLFAFLLRRIRRVRGHITAAAPASEELKRLQAACREQIGLRRAVDLRVAGNSISPAVCGLWRPIVLIPSRLVGVLSRAQLRGVLLHELAHIKRCDVGLNYAQTLLQIFYWWHPLLWLANAHIRRLREQAVDELVMVALAGEAEIYPTTLVEVARLGLTRPTLSLGLIGIVESRSALKQRIARLLSRPVPRQTKLGLTGALGVAFAAALLLPMARGQQKVPRAPAAAVLSNIDQSTNVTLTVRFVELPDASLEELNLGQPSMTTEGGHLAWELTSDQLRNLVERLEQRDGVTLLTAPSVKTRSDSQTQVQIVDPARLGVMTNSGNWFQPTPVCDLVPHVNGDEIDLTILARITESSPGIPGNVFRANPTDDRATSEPRDATMYAVDTIAYIDYDVGTARISIADGEGVVLRNPAVKNTKGNNFLVVISPKINRADLESAQISPLPADREESSERNRRDHAQQPSSPGKNSVIPTIAGHPLASSNGPGIGPLIVTITKDPPHIHLGSSLATFETLREEFTRAAATDPGAGLSLRVESDASSDDLFKVMEIAKAAGLRTVSALTGSQRAGLQSPPGNATEQTSPLVTRTFKVNPAMFLENLRHAFSSSSSTNVLPMVRDFFQAAGVHTDPPNTIFFHDRTGVLLIRASEQDLDAAQRAIELLNASPAQITVETRFVEIPPSAARKLGLDLPAPGETSNTWSRVLTAREAKVIFQAAEQLGGVDMLSAPKVTTLSGRLAQTQVVEAKTILMGINPQALAAPGVQSTNGVKPQPYLTSSTLLGPSLNVTPEATQNGTTIHLEASPSFTEFLGYDTPPKELRIWIDGREQTATVPLPRLRTRRIQADLDVNDGQTLVLGNPEQTVVSSKPDGGTQTASGPEDAGRRLLVFITPTIIDPAGNPIHTREAHTVPPQAQP